MNPTYKHGFLQFGRSNENLGALQPVARIKLENDDMWFEGQWYDMPETVDRIALGCNFLSINVYLIAEWIASTEGDAIDEHVTITNTGDDTVFLARLDIGLQI